MTIIRRSLGWCAGGLALALAATLGGTSITTAAPPEADPPAMEPTSATSTPGENYVALQFGVFMHYGLATYVKKRPWDYDPHEVSPLTFAPPAEMDTDQWMQAAASSGAKYVIFTAKHHDGFALWPSDYTDYDVASSSAPDRDIVQEVVDSAREFGLKPVLYYSWLDFYKDGGSDDEGNYHFVASPEYVQFAKNQITELLTEYGDIAGLWLDTAPGKFDSGRLQEIKDHIAAVSPTTAFVPNTHLTEKRGGTRLAPADVLVHEAELEGDLPCDATRPHEQSFLAVQPNSAGWGWWSFASRDTTVTTAQDVMVELMRANSIGGAAAVNASPGPDGKLGLGNVNLLAEVGALRTSPTAYVTIDDMVPPCGGTLTYSGQQTDSDWIHTRGTPTGGGKWFFGTRTHSNTVGATATLTFSGPDITVLFEANPGHGIAEISVDGGPPVAVNTYSATRRQSQPLFERHNLGPGPHTLTVEVTGRKDDASANTFVSLEGFRINASANPTIVPVANVE
ncbi:hypothetical protein E1212_26675 [Jiangella ureilytica]|uniref:alpha-L-fucosidase n=1 Tax=Jiangella ureilytica TaxID=2530374 RepID=A0A4R4RBM9_9ACTN|nr:alpha-L-fucosidase [Jiangella ureilytica]TDC46516.1 hypothetical protein E1212_26675 [Jiangella ureilytica]